MASASLMRMAAAFVDLHAGEVRKCQQGIMGMLGNEPLGFVRQQHDLSRRAMTEVNQHDGLSLVLNESNAFFHGNSGPVIFGAGN